MKRTMLVIMVLLVSFAFGQNTSEDIWTDNSAFSIYYNNEVLMLRTIEPANSFNFYFESNEIVTITDNMFAKMTEEEMENFFVLYLAARGYNWANNSRANFFGRSLEINGDRYLEILCHKLLAQWIFDEQEKQ